MEVAHQLPLFFAPIFTPDAEMLISLVESSDKNAHTYNSNFVYMWEKAMAPHSSTLAWKIPWTEEPGRLQSMGSLRVDRD